MEAFLTGGEWGGPDHPQPPEHHPGVQERPVPRGRAAVTQKCPLSPPSQHLIPFKARAWHLEAPRLCRVPRRLLPLNLRNISKLLSRLWLI